MAPGPLSARVAGLCQEVGHRLGGPTQGQVFDVRRRLSEPLRVAIAGRLKSGKSTLVNALIGRRVAPTEVGECTRIVTLKGSIESDDRTTYTSTRNTSTGPGRTGGRTRTGDGYAR